MTPEEPYDLPRLKAMTQSLRDLLLGAAEGAGPEQRQALTEVADSFQRITQDFETEHGKLETAIAAKLVLARQKMEQAQAVMLQVDERVKKIENPDDEPDWTLAPKLRDELLARRKVAPPPPALDPTGSLAPWAMSNEPVPDAPAPPPVPVHAPPAAPHVAQSLASWLSDEPPAPGDAGTDAPQGDPNSEEWKQSMKQWLTKPRGKPKPPE